MTGRFSNEVRARLPEVLHLPDAFAAVFDWAEEQGQRGVFRNRDSADFGAHYLSIYPPDAIDADGASYVIFNFELGPPIHAPSEAMLARMATVARISGDGGRLGFWCDDDGKQWVVVFDHGWPHVLTDDPMAALQFLAIGYPEPACVQDANLTAEAQAARDYGSAPLLPVAYRDFLSGTFGCAVPPTAAELGLRIPAPEDPDPLRGWMAAETPAPDRSRVPGLTAGNTIVVTADLAASLGPERLAAIRSTYPFVKIET